MDFVVKFLHGGGPLSHKQGGLIHQFGVSLGGDLKNRLLLLLLFYFLYVFYFLVYILSTNIFMHLGYCIMATSFSQGLSRLWSIVLMTDKFHAFNKLLISNISMFSSDFHFSYAVFFLVFLHSSKLYSMYKWIVNIV